MWTLHIFVVYTWLYDGPAGSFHLKCIWNYLSTAAHELRMNHFRILYEFHLYFAWSSNELSIDWIWIITWRFHVHFTCIAYAIHMNLVCNSSEFHIKFISNSYQIHMNFTRILYWKTHGSFMQTSYELYMKFVWNSYKLHESFICTPYAAHMRYSWNLHEINDNEFSMHMEFIWNWYKVIVSCFLQTSIVFDMSCIWSTYETIMQFVWSSYDVHMKFACNFCVSSYTNFSLSSGQKIWSSYKIYMKFR